LRWAGKIICLLDHTNGVRRAALLYSLVSTARLQNLEPLAYIKDVLTRISDYPYKNIKDLLPANWKTPEE